MRVLKRRRCFFVELGRVRAEDQENDRVTVEFHLRSPLEQPVAVPLGRCADVCGVPLEVRLVGDAIGALDGVVMQFALPAREWWKDIVFT